MLEELVVAVLVQVHQVLVLVQLSNAEDGVHQCLVIELGHIVFHLSQHCFVFHPGEQLLVKVALGDVAARRKLLHQSSSDEGDVRKVWLGDIKQRESLMRILQGILDVVKVLIKSEVVEAYLLVILLLLLIKI